MLYKIPHADRQNLIQEVHSAGSQQDVYHGYLKIDIRDVYTLRHE